MRVRYFLSVKSLAMAAATLKFLGQELKAYNISPGGLWMHCYAAAELAREFAAEAGQEDESQDAVYVGALLHDIGKIVLGSIMEGSLRDSENHRAAEEGETVLAWEERVTGIDHCGVGDRITSKWRLAPLAMSCVKDHHSWEGAPPEFRREVAIVALADAARRLRPIHNPLEPATMPHRAPS